MAHTAHPDVVATATAERIAARVHAAERAALAEHEASVARMLRAMAGDRQGIAATEWRGMAERAENRAADHATAAAEHNAHATDWASIAHVNR